MRNLNLEEVRNAILNSSETSSIYVGCDSITSYRDTTFALVVVIHIDSSKGGMVFAKKTKESRKMDVRERLMKEVELAVGLSLEIIDVIGHRNFELHLDINPDPIHKSNVVMAAACGYASAQGLEYRIKPDAFAATYAADALLH